MHDQIIYSNLFLNKIPANLISTTVSHQTSVPHPCSGQLRITIVLARAYRAEFMNSFWHCLKKCHSLLVLAECSLRCCLLQTWPSHWSVSVTMSGESNYSMLCRDYNLLDTRMQFAIIGSTTSPAPVFPSFLTMSLI